MLSELDEIKLTDPQVEPLLLRLIQIYNTKKATNINFYFALIAASLVLPLFLRKAEI